MINYVHQIERAVSTTGGNCLVRYMDTDSILYDKEDMTDGYTKALFERIMHSTELGKFKSETKGKGILAADLFGKKFYMYMLARDDIHDRKRVADGDASGVRLDGEVCVKFVPDIIKVKGVPKKSLTEVGLLQLHQTPHLKRGFILPARFEKSIKEGIIKTEGCTRRVKANNLCRNRPIRNGFLASFKDFEAYEISKKQYALDNSRDIS